MRSIALALALFAGSASAVSINIPEQYYVEAELIMPYYNLVEPITAYYCTEGGMGRLDYWGGVQRYIYNASGQGYQIVPTAFNGVSSTETCFLTSMNEEPVSVFPDVTYFPTTPDEGPCEVGGIACESYTLISPTYNDTTGFDGNYTLYVDANTGIPLRFHFTGFNVILGSHYDEYIFNYLKVETSLDGKEPGCFYPPAQMTCQQLETDDGDDDAGGPTLDAKKKNLLQRPRPTVPEREHHHLDTILPRKKEHSKRAVDAKRGRHEAWAQKHGKKYANEEERAQRAALFHATENYVNAMNRRHLSFWLGVNHMADWSAEEKKKLRGRKHTPEGFTVDATFTHETLGRDQDDIDWRDLGAVTPVHDQGSCGSCWSFGAAQTIEGAQFLKTGVLTPFSEQILMDCSWSEGNDACDGGLDFRGYEWMLKYNKGDIATAASYPYLNADGYCRAASTAVGATITGYANITDGLDGLNDALATVGPISVSIDAAPDSFYFYQGGLYNDPDCLSGMNDLDHTVLAVGYTTIDGQRYSIVKNSWSTHWGDEGYVYITQENNCCGVATQPTYTTV